MKDWLLYWSERDWECIEWYLPQIIKVFVTITQVKDVASKEPLKDELKWVKFSSIAWTHDNKGFFYQVRHHRVTCKPKRGFYHYYCLYITLCCGLLYYTVHVHVHVTHGPLSIQYCTCTCIMLCVLCTYYMYFTPFGDQRHLLAAS